MTSYLRHRGPNDAGYWTDHERRIGLGHRRLSIQDTSAAGRQPMLSPDERYVLTYNGELYNGSQLRHELPGTIQWKGSSDTEILLHGIQHWGVVECIRRSVGMFAIALFDRLSREIVLVRDRLGIKPLYFSVQGKHAYWSSELKAIVSHSAFRAETDPRSLHLFLQLGYLPAPQSIYRQTWKVIPGTLVSIPIDSPDDWRTSTYWSAADAARLARGGAMTRSENDLLDEGRTLLREIVREHLVSDVPVGAFLSGGVDSALVTALMADVSSTPVRTYSIGFHEPSHDEAPRARRIAEHLGAVHTEHYIDESDVLRLIPEWATHYCEPFSDTSGLPTMVLARQARQDVTVALSGDGGDELFGGYSRYRRTQVLHGRVQRIPGPLRSVLRQLLDWPRSTWYDRLEPLQHLVARRRVVEGVNETVRKLKAILDTNDARGLYECLSSVSFHAHHETLHLANHDCRREILLPDAIRDNAWQSDWTLSENMQLWDTLVYLPGDILHKVDIASMAVGLEVRVPLLDHRLFEWSWSLPHDWKSHAGHSKRMLRRQLEQYVPSSLTDGPKRGFSAPIGAWLRGPLREWAESLLTNDVLERSGLFRATIVRQFWDDLIEQRADYARIWPVLTYLAWQETQTGVSSSPQGNNRETAFHEHCLRN